MKQPGQKERASVVYIGKGVIIAVVIFTASASFILGFFVGRSFRPLPANQEAAVPQPNIAAQPDNVSVQPADPVKEQPAQERRLADETGKPAATEASQQAKPLVEAQKPREVPDVKKARADSVKHEKPVTAEPSKASKKRRYTVQVEALKSSAAAEALTERLVKKGFKASVVSYSTKRHERLFKVFVGEFATKKEAEVMSVKLKRTENLQHPFVTFKSE